MSVKLCYVELIDNKPVRIFKRHQNYLNCTNQTKQMVYSEAVSVIRKQVVARADGECERCGSRITALTGEMDERIPRGRGGEVSLANCWLLCHDCHTGLPDSQHGNRRWGGRKN